MSEYDNTNTGALFKNDKGDNEKRPDYKGNVNVGGTEYYLSAWLRTSKAGAKFMSLKVEPKDKSATPSTPAKNHPADVGGELDDVPF